MSYDFGPYGKGIDGYVNYMQSVNNAKKERDAAKRTRLFDVGCVATVISVIAVFLLLARLYLY